MEVFVPSGVLMEIIIKPLKGKKKVEALLVIFQRF